MTGRQLSWFDSVGELRPSEIARAASAMSAGALSTEDIAVRLAAIVDRTVHETLSEREIETLVVMAADVRAVFAAAGVNLNTLASYKHPGPYWHVFRDALAGRSMYDIANSHLRQSEEKLKTPRATAPRFIGNEMTNGWGKKRKRKITRREWTASDLRMLKSLAKKAPAKQIAQKLRRSEGAVRQKAFVLGTSFGKRKRRRK
jgi:hypothetical protein